MAIVASSKKCAALKIFEFICDHTGGLSRAKELLRPPPEGESKWMSDYLYTDFVNIMVRDHGGMWRL